jgi:S-adenosylmethionine:diacylglycerol 3-amino-3-carboxypropyl transferase
MPFGFDVRDKTKKVSIREQKLKEMLAEQERALVESMKPFKCKDVPKFVTDNLYEKMLKDEARERKERL